MLQCFLVAFGHLVLHACVAVATRLRLFVDLGDAALDGLQVAQLQFQVNHFLVAHRVHIAVHVSDIVVVKTSEHMQDGIGLADVGQESVPESLAATGAFHQACNVHNFDGGGDNALGMHELGQAVQPLVGHGDDPHIGLDGAERKVGRLCLGVRQTVKQSRLTHVGKSHNSTL